MLKKPVPYDPDLSNYIGIELEHYDKRISAHLRGLWMLVLCQAVCIVGLAFAVWSLGTR